MNTLQTFKQFVRGIENQIEETGGNFYATCDFSDGSFIEVESEGPGAVIDFNFFKGDSNEPTKKKYEAIRLYIINAVDEAEERYENRDEPYVDDHDNTYGGYYQTLR